MKRLSTLRLRFALWTAGLLCAALTLFGLWVYSSMARNLTAAVDRTLHATALQMIDEGADRGQVSLSDFDDPQYTYLHEQGLSMRLFDQQATLRQRYGPYTALPQPTPSGAFLAGLGTYATIREPATRATVRLLTMPVRTDDGAEPLGILQVALDLRNIQETLHALWVTLLVAIPAIVVIAGWGGYFLATRALLPIDQITQMARTISAQDLSARLNLPHTNDEAGRLAATFDAMLARLERGFRREQQFTADASHELRTPLAAMQTIIESTLARHRTVAEYEEALTDLHQEAEHMRVLAIGLLQLARSDATKAMATETVQIAWLVKDVVESLRPLAEEKGLTLLDTVAADPLPISGDSDTLLRLLVNLVDNAIKYTPRGTITVAAHPNATAYVITISDTGMGIAPEHLPHLFDRFYRVDSARGQHGIGLGLAIAQSIAQAHGGMIAVQSEPGVGSTFTVTLPLGRVN